MLTCLLEYKEFPSFCFLIWCIINDRMCMSVSHPPLNQLFHTHTKNPSNSQVKGGIIDDIPSKEVSRLTEKRSKFSSASPTTISVGRLVFPERDFFRLQSLIGGLQHDREERNRIEMETKQREWFLKF